MSIELLLVHILLALSWLPCPINYKCADFSLSNCDKHLFGHFDRHKLLCGAVLTVSIGNIQITEKNKYTGQPNRRYKHTWGSLSLPEILDLVVYPSITIYLCWLTVTQRSLLWWKPVLCERYRCCTTVT